MQKSGMYNYLDVGEMKSRVYNCMDHKRPGACSPHVCSLQGLMS